VGFHFSISKFCVETPNCAVYLQLNEVPATPLTVGLDGRLTGEAILAHANALGCDLLICTHRVDCGK
jgi:nucleotide-binding universal stress UspA family protein